MYKTLLTASVLALSTMAAVPALAQQTGTPAATSPQAKTATPPDTVPPQSTQTDAPRPKAATPETATETNDAMVDPMATETDAMPAQTPPASTDAMTPQDKMDHGKVNHDDMMTDDTTTTTNSDSSMSDPASENTNTMTRTDVDSQDSMDSADEPETASSASDSGTQADPSAVMQFVTQQFPTYDADSNGNLSTEEFAAWLLALRTEQQPDAEPMTADQASKWTGEAFASADTDKNSQVSPAELAKFLMG